VSTRSTTHFVYPGEPTEAIIYRHSDGYPEGAGKDLVRFLEITSELPDPRHGDPSYLAAKYVVYLASLFAKDDILDFLSVGVMREDPTDIEYRYVVTAGNPATLQAYEVSCSYPDNVWTETPVEIPA
jgi:hypothetical protein